MDNHSPESFTIALIGEPGTGKTSIQNALLDLPFQEPKTTVGVDIKPTYFFANDQKYKFKICDVAGQESHLQLRRTFMRNSDAAILVFDLTDRSSFQRITEWIKEYCLASKSKSTPILIVGNKLDLTYQREISLRDVQSLLRLVRDFPQVEGRIIGYAETSAKTGENIKSSIQNLTAIITSAA